jgi:hypothetical protein
MISFVWLRPAAAEPGGRNVDAEATKLVAAPIAAGATGETTPSPIRPPLSQVATVVKPAPQAGPPNARAAVFHPERDAAGPDEPTRRWSTDAVLVHPPTRTLDMRELQARLKSAWRTNRRPFVLAGAAVWIALLLGLMALKQPPASDDDDAPPAVAQPRPTTPKPAVTPPATSATGGTVAPTGGTVAPTGDNVVEPSTDRDQDLADAIAAYDNGRPQEALRYFRRLSTDPNDKVARFMVGLIEARGAAAP